MKWYCEKCKKLHMENELCPSIKRQLRQNPSWVAGAADFAVVAGSENLIRSQTLNNVVQEINKLVGTNLSYEGTQQFARDIQVFKRLSEEPFSRSGVFSTPESAKTYLENVLKVAQDKPGALTSFESKLTGYGQEVDWLRLKHGEISALWEKSVLLQDNAPGVDGVTINRFTGKTISRTTIKASKNPMTSNSTGIKDVQAAIQKGSATKGDIIFGPKGTKEAARSAGLKNPVVEKNTSTDIRRSNERLEKKILNGEANAAPTMKQIGNKIGQGALVGAAVAVTVTSITAYVRYKNGEISIEEAFANIAEDTLKGTLIGGAMGGITIFLPGGVIGFVAGMAIGVYFNTACKNILDEVFGNGAYGAILNASGYVYGMTFNLAKYYGKIRKNEKKIEENIAKAEKTGDRIREKLQRFEKDKGELLL